MDLYSEYTQNSQSSIRKQNRPKYMNLHFIKERTQIANKYERERLSTSTARKMQIKATLRYHYTPIRMTTIK